MSARFCGLSRRLQWLGLGQNKCGVPQGLWGPQNLALFCCFSQAINRNVDRKWSSWDVNWCPHGTPDHRSQYFITLAPGSNISKLRTTHRITSKPARITNKAASIPRNEHQRFQNSYDWSRRQSIREGVRRY